MDVKVNGISGPLPPLPERKAEVHLTFYCKVNDSLKWAASVGPIPTDAARLNRISVPAGVYTIVAHTNVSISSAYAIAEADCSNGDVVSLHWSSVPIFCSGVGNAVLRPGLPAAVLAGDKPPKRVYVERVDLNGVQYDATGDAGWSNVGPLELHLHQIPAGRVRIRVIDSDGGAWVSGIIEVAAGGTTGVGAVMPWWRDRFFVSVADLPVEEVWQCQVRAVLDAGTTDWEELLAADSRLLPSDRPDSWLRPELPPLARAVMTERGCEILVRAIPPGARFLELRTPDGRTARFTTELGASSHLLIHPR